MTETIVLPPLFAQDPRFSEQVFVFLGAFGLILVFLIGLALIVAWQARRRGYSLWVWLLAGLSGNPIFFLFLLGVLPDFAKRKLRKTEMEDLESRLNAKTRPAAEAVLPTGDVQRSLGDQVTSLPERSLGDVETRL